MTTQYTKLAGALALLAAGSAQAVHVAESGQALIFPYYTVNGGNQTLVQISNTHADEYKALKVRFVEGTNGRDVLYFHLYLAPNDTFAAAIYSDDANGPALIANPDSSCTVPAFQNQPVPFRNFAYAGPNDDGLGDTPLRTREGHLEVIEMAVIDPEDLPAAVDLDNCSTLITAWRPDGVWDENPATGTLPPSGGLRGSASIVDVNEGVLYAYNATALANFSGRSLHTPVGDSKPDLASGSGATAEADLVSSMILENGNVLHSTWPVAQAIDAVSAVLSAARIGNQFNREAAIGAATEWVVSYPTKAYYTDDAPGGKLPTDSSPIAPFNETVLGNTAPPPNGPQLIGGACNPAAFAPVSRNGGAPLRVNDGELHCYTTQVLSFDEGAAQTGSLRPVLQQIDFSTPPDEMPASGYANWTFGEAKLRPSSEGHLHQGVPALALSLERIVNANAEPGMLANYASTTTHSVDRACETAESEACE